jgi:hypothetical protein
VLLLRDPSADLDRRPRLAGSELRGAASSFTDVRVEPPDGVRLAVPPKSLAWPSQDHPDPTYRVYLLDAEMTPLWHSEALGATRLVLPPQALDTLAPAQLYFWSVELIGTTQKSLGPFAFEILGNP